MGHLVLLDLSGHTLPTSSLFNPGLRRLLQLVLASADRHSSHRKLKLLLRGLRHQLQALYVVLPSSEIDRARGDLPPLHHFRDLLNSSWRETSGEDLLCPTGRAGHTGTHQRSHHLFEDAPSRHHCSR